MATRCILTSSQQSFVDGLRVANTDNRAIKIVEAALLLSNASAAQSIHSLVNARQHFNDAVKEVD